MKRTLLIVFAIATVALTAHAASRQQTIGQYAQQPAVASANQKGSTQVRKAKGKSQKAKVSRTQQSGSQVTAAAAIESDQSLTQVDSVGGHESADAVLVIGLDTSLSIKREFPKTQAAAKAFVVQAPSSCLVGAVGFDLEAKKELFNNHAKAISFIDSLRANGGYTDFNRGVDAMLSELQRANAKREVLIFLTDGQQSVPKRFKDRSDFWQILKRELSVRPQVRALVLSVNDPQAATVRDLPPNVTIFAPANWDDAVRLTRSSLATEIGAQLTAPAPAVEQPSAKTPAVQGKTRFVIAGALVLLLVLAMVSILLWRRRLRTIDSVTLEPKQMPENAMRSEDLKMAFPPELAPEPLVLLDFRNGDQGPRPVKRIPMRSGDSIIVGGSPYSSDLCLADLKQTQTLELKYDGAALTGVRLRPDMPGKLDEVQLSEAEAPIAFVLSKDAQLTIGTYQVNIQFTDETILRLLDRQSSLTAGGSRVLSHDSPKLSLRR